VPVLLVIPIPAPVWVIGPLIVSGTAVSSVALPLRFSPAISSDRFAPATLNRVLPIDTLPSR